MLFSMDQRIVITHVIERRIIIDGDDSPSNRRNFLRFYLGGLFGNSDICQEDILIKFETTVFQSY